MRNGLPHLLPSHSPFSVNAPISNPKRGHISSSGKKGRARRRIFSPPGEKLVLRVTKRHPPFPPSQSATLMMRLFCLFFPKKMSACALLEYFIRVDEKKEQNSGLHQTRSAEPWLGGHRLVASGAAQPVLGSNVRWRGACTRHRGAHTCLAELGRGRRMEIYRRGGMRRILFACYFSSSSCLPTPQPPAFSARIQ